MDVEGVSAVQQLQCQLDLMIAVYLQYMCHG